MGHPLPLRSQPYNFSPGAAQPIPLNFMEPALNGMNNPKIRALRLYLGLFVTTGSSGGPARLMPEIISRVVLNDGATERVNITGYSLRLVQHAEFTGRYADGVDLGTGLGSTLFELWLDILPCDVEDEASEDDHGILVSDLLNGGNLTIYWAQATPHANYTTFLTTSTVEVHAEIEEATPGKLYPRHVLKDVPMQSTDFRYAASIRGRWLMVAVGAGDTIAQAGWGAQDFTSRDLDINVIRQGKFQNDYRRRGSSPRVGDAAAVVATEDPFLRAAPEVVALFMPQNGQKISECPVWDSVQVKTSLGSIGSNNPMVIMSGYTNRSPELEAAALGSPSTAAATSAIASKGVISDTNTPAGSRGLGSLARQLPVTVKAA